MMSLNNSIKNSCFSAIFDSSDAYENYPDKKTCIKKDARTVKMVIELGITV